MSILVGIYGASGAGRGVLPLARVQFADRPDTRIVFIDDHLRSRIVNGHEVMSFNEFLMEPEHDKKASIAIADPNTREMLAQKCFNNNVFIETIEAANVVKMDDIMIGDGAILSPFVCITSNIRIGRLFHANIGSIIEHDCIIGDYVTFAPGVRCNGSVIIGDYVYVGAGATIKQGTIEKPRRIGEGAIIGMGAVVIKDVLAGTTVMGNPARVFKG